MNNPLYDTAAIFVIGLGLAIPAGLILIYYRIDRAVSLLEEIHRETRTLNQK